MRKILVFCVVATLAASAAKKDVPTATLGPLKQVNTSGKRGTEQMGVHRKINARLLQKGKWDASGWKLILRSPGAKGLRLHVTDMDLRDSKLVLRGSDGQEQTYQGRGPNGDGEFWTRLVEGDAVTIELRSQEKTDQLPFGIPELSHLWALPY